MSEEIYTVIVADDEPEICEAVCQMVDWEQLGFRLVGSAGNGVDALQMVEQLQPDLLLTDIEMPFISGTELSRQVREVQPLIQVAFLSGYDDFEYVQSAIENQVIAYLLKPLSMAELTEELRGIHRKMQSRFQELRPVPSHMSRHIATATLLLDAFPSNQSEQSIRNRLYDCGMVFTEPYLLAVISIGAADFRQSAAQTVEKVIQKYYSCSAVVSGERILCLVVSEDGFSRLGVALDELYCVGKRLLSFAFNIGVSRSFTDLTQCHAACREAVDAQTLASESGIYHYEQLQENADRLSSDHIQRIEQMLLNEDDAELRNWLQSALRAPHSDFASMNLLFAAQEVVARYLGERDTALLLRRSQLENPFGTGASREEMDRRVAEFCLAGMERIRERKKKGIGFLCERALDIIERCYMDPELSLATVSSRLHVSPNYLSANIKKYAGETFINLVIKRRMEAAAQLLRDKTMKITEVSERCGYNDQHYFSYCFKKYYGVSPSVMRRGGETE